MKEQIKEILYPKDDVHFDIASYSRQIKRLEAAIFLMAEKMDESKKY